jgi:ankyrin repeat protein
MRKAVLYTLLVAGCLAIFGCGKSKDQAIHDLAGLNLKFTADDFVATAARGDMKALNLFFVAGIDVNVPNSSGQTALMAAAEKGRLDAAKALLDHRAGLNLKDRDGITALMLATVANHPDLTKLLVDRHADVTLQDNNGWTAMMKAVYQGNVGCVTVLAEHSKEELDRSLLIAALTGHKDVLQVLLDHGAEVDTRASDGRTALMLASSKDNREIVDLLLKAGADPTLTDHAGLTAEKLASSKDFNELVSTLQHAPPPAARSAAAKQSSPSAAGTTPISDKDFLAASSPTAGNPAGPTPNGLGTQASETASSPLSAKVSVKQIDESFLPITLLAVQGRSAELQNASGETYKVNAGDQLKGLDYRVLEVESRNVNDKDGNEVDASLVKLRSLKTGETVSLTKGVPARERGASVVLGFKDSNETAKVGLDQTFSIPGEPDHTYKILDIRPKQVVVRRDDDRVWTLQKTGE